MASVFSVKAASGSWTGATDNTWAGANWSATSVPGTGDTATFNGAGGGHTTIDLGSGVTISNLLFNTGSAAAYTIGNGVVGSQTLTNNNSGAITVNSTVASNELFNAAFVLGTDATLQTNTIVNNSTNVLTFAGNIYGGSGGTVGTKTLAVGGSGNTVVSGNITNGGATTVAITKTGTGNLTINGTVNATTGLNSQGAFGTVAINAGNLVLDFSNSTNADLLDNYSPVSMGGGTLQVIGNSTNASTQNFTNGSGVTLNPGFNVITIGPNGGNMSDPLPTLNLGAFPQTLGSQTMFVGPSYNTNYSGGTVTNLAATGTITTTTLGLQNKLLWPSTRVAVATAGLYNWASVVTSGSGSQSILAGDQVSGFYTTVSAGGAVANADANYDLLGNATFANSKPAFVDTLRFNVPGAFTATTGAGGSGFLFLVGGILVTPNVGANNTTLASGGEWIAGANTGNNTTCGLDVYQNNTAGELFISAPIYFWTSTARATSYVKGGAGTVDLTGSAGNSAYTGSAYLNGGCTVINNNAQLGATASAKTLFLNGGTVVASTSLTLGNGVSANPRPVTLLGNGGGLAAYSGTTLTVDGQIGSAAGTGPLVIGIPASAANGSVAGQLPGTGTGTANSQVLAAGTVKLNNTTGNFYYGGVNIVGGATLNINGIYALGGSDYLGGVTFNNGTLQYANGTLLGGADISSGGTGGTVPQTVSILGNATIDLNGQTVTYAGSIGNGGSGALTVLDSTGGGSLTLTGGGTYTGTTSVGDGTHAATLNVNGSLASSAVTVKNAVLGGTGTIAGATTLQPFAVLAPGSGGVGQLTFSGNLTLNALSTNSFVITPAGGIMNSNSVGGTLAANNSVVSVTSGAALQPNNSYTLFTYSPSKPVSGSFNPVPVFDVAPAQRAYITNNATLGQINLVVVPNTTPAGTGFTLNATLNIPSTVQIIGGKNAATDANGDPLTVTAVTQGANGTVTFTPTNITYTATNTTATSDSFTYTVGDAYGNSSSATTVSVVIDNSVQGQTGYNQVGAQMAGGQEVLSYAGIPGYNYALDETHSMVPPIIWTPVTTNTVSATGSLLFTNTPSGGSDFYRTRYVP